MTDDDMQVIEELLDRAEMQGPTLAGERTEAKHTHRWVRVSYMVNGVVGPVSYECRCGKVRSEIHARRGRTSRSYGNRAELHASRKYGGDKIGAAGGPVDIRGKDFATQMKTHRRPVPAEWRKVFGAMAQENRCPRLLLRFVQGPGKEPADYFVFEAKAFLDWFGRDE